MASFSTMKSNISLRLIDAGNTAISDASVGTAINQAIKYWKRKPFWFNEFAETITISSTTFSLVSNTPLALFTEGGVTIEDSDTHYPLTKISSVEFDQKNDEATGRPEYWTYRNQAFQCYRYPDQSYTAIVRGYKDYSDLSAAGDTNDFTDNAQDLIEYEALSRLYAELRQDINMASYYAGKAKDEYKELVSFHSAKAATGRFEIESVLL